MAITPFKEIMLLFCIMVVVAACTNNSLVGESASRLTATPTTGVILPPTPTIKLSPTSTNTPIPSPTHTPTPVPTATPDPAAACHVPGKDGRISVIGDEELQEHHARLETLEALREVIRREYPGWAGYTQQLTFGKMVVTYDMARILVNAGFPCLEGPCPYQISVNPAVILTVITTQYGDEPPPGFDAWRTARQIALDIGSLYEKNQAHPEVWQDRFASAASYVMYQIFGQEEDRLRAWCVAYHTFYTLTQQVIEP